MKESILDITINIMDGGKLVSRHNEQIKILTPDVDEFMAELMRHAPTIRSAQPKPPEGERARIFGVPVVENPHIPPGTAMFGTPCDCSPAEMEADGGALLHLAKRHWVIMKFSDESNQTRKEEGESPASAPAGGSPSDNRGG
jgi:hypothetical protein